MISSPYEKYKQSSVQTSTPGQLVIMLYDGAIRFTKTGLEGIEARDYSKANVNLGKAQTIISELMSTLNQSYPVAKTLFSLYEYMNYLLIQANIKKDSKYGEEVLGYLQELRETWAAASKQVAGTIPND
ncbi:flagellar export chaperone FliS [Paenibacillus sp. FSL L8-0435]|uniref:flagellar export chaperone FliS n=1 Tax=Paenibacillus TaxID=44249 RepID=UPI001C8EEED9|nr:flagellar export chaperone FliS [Paenibacillus xylanexedens]MBY0118838.1 flagellar export chaperone FliS [Paenibacillus xylanexedens]